MAYAEEFGELPNTTLKVFRKYKVTPAEYDLMVAFNLTFRDMENEVLTHLRDGMYAMPWPFGR